MWNLTAGAWVTVKNGRPMRCRVHQDDEVLFVLGPQRQDFEFVFQTDSLRRFVKLATDALSQVEAGAFDDADSAPE
ncbi:MAG: hypothetical protein M3548_24575 [Actinomycetota bacterium]|nr:hypothetical protein [Actinomycetota bacterium]